MAIGGIALAIIAGVLSVLSPCVLPFLPIVLGEAASKHRLGPMALTAGLVGLFRDRRAVRRDNRPCDRSQWKLIAHRRRCLDYRAGPAGRRQRPIAAWTDQRFGQSHGNGLSSQFCIGAFGLLLARTGQRRIFRRTDTAPHMATAPN